MSDVSTCPSRHPDEHRCAVCDAELLHEQLQADRPLAPHEKPVADLG